jgi:MFS family permease
MSPLGLLVAGPLADLLGVRAWYIAGAAVCAVMGVGGFFLAPLYALEESAVPAAAPEPIAATEPLVTTMNTPG